MVLQDLYVLTGLLITLLAAYASFRYFLKREIRGLKVRLADFERRMNLLDSCAQDVVLSLQHNSDFFESRKQFRKQYDHIRARLERLESMVTEGSEEELSAAAEILHFARRRTSMGTPREPMVDWEVSLELLVQKAGKDILSALRKKYQLGNTLPPTISAFGVLASVGIWTMPDIFSARMFQQRI